MFNLLVEMWKEWGKDVFSISLYLFLVFCSISEVFSLAEKLKGKGKMWLQKCSSVSNLHSSG